MALDGLPCYFDPQQLRRRLSALSNTGTATAAGDSEPRASTALLVDVIASSALTHADRVALVRMSLEAGADPNASTRDGEPVVLHALLNDLPEIAVDLISNGARWKSLIPDTSYPSLLHKLVANGSVCMLRVIDELDPELDWEPDDAPIAYIPLLYLAVCTQHLDVAEFLLQRRRRPVNVDAMWAARITPIARAVDLEASEMVQLLIAHGANVELHGPGAPPPLAYAARRGNVKIARQLIEAGALGDPCGSIPSIAITTSIQSGNVEMTRLLLEHNVPCVAVVPQRHSLLLGAVMRSDRAMTRLLLEEAFVDVAADANKFELLSYALRNDDKLVLKALHALQSEPEAVERKPGTLGGATDIESFIPHRFRLAAPKVTSRAKELAIRRAIQRQCKEKN
ncbi:hypothetical protein ATCC90586_008848 [Pythium insidiosum]|nr:hypothetical protein ATCC90586_008848 [Pythium insidiosum]